MTPYADPARGARNLAALAAHLGPDRFAALLPPFSRTLPESADPDMATNNLERLLANPAAHPYLPALLADDGRKLADLMTLLSVSQFFADTLAGDPDAVAAVLTPPPRSPSTSELTQQLKQAADAAGDDAGVLRAFRRFRTRQHLRVGINDVIRDRPLEEISRDLARVADASIEVAIQFALRTAAKKFGTPAGADGTPARITALAFGKLGGDELNYSSDIDLMFVYDRDGETTGKRAGVVPNSEFFARVITDVIRILSAPTDAGLGYRVDLRLRPEGSRGPLARSLDGTLSYYDVMGRTWERQALIKLRHCGGDPDLGRDFLRAVEPFVYRKYFSFSEINEVKALKRKMEQHATRSGADDRDVKTGRGGIRDIEYTVQFLQLLNGGDLPAVRQRNTLLALDALEIAGCLTGAETYILADAYRFLRKTEHRLQLLFDMQTHKLPQAADDLRRLARRMGYQEGSRIADRGLRIEKPGPEQPELRSQSPELSAQRRSPLDEAAPPEGPSEEALFLDPLDQFLKDLHEKTDLDRAILDHLLHQTFAADKAVPEADLILDPNADDAGVRAVLGKYGFRDVAAAYQNLTQLARESVPFLSHRRCRHFLASIAPPLLAAVAATPDPDAALNNLEKVTASLGAKAVLYELFSTNPAALKLYVDLCSGSPFLSALLINNPGMIDDLLDSLVLDSPRTPEELRAELAELCRGASDLEPILHSFQDKELLRIGVRDLLGKADVRETATALSDLAESVLNGVFAAHEAGVKARLGVPACRYAVLGLGKLGGRELGYHSDLDLIVVYEADGQTEPPPNRPATSAQHYFTTLTQQAIQQLTRSGPMGRLYAVDMRLRPTGRSGSLVVSLPEFARYFAPGGGAAAWERLALVRGRVVREVDGFGESVAAAVRDAVLGEPWSPALATAVCAMRERLQAAASPGSFKRGPGGMVDVEFVAQALAMKYGREYPEVLTPTAWDGLAAAVKAGVLPAEEADLLTKSYTFLRTVEFRLRAQTDRPLTGLPADSTDRTRLARRLGYATPDALAAEVGRVTTALRNTFLRVMARERV